MRAIASYILKGPLQAGLSAAVPAAISVGAPFVLKLLLIYFSGIVVALVSLRLGGRKGLIILAAAVLAALLTGQLLGLKEIAQLDLWSAVFFWALLWLAASVLQVSRSLSLAFETIGFVAISMLVAFYLLVDDSVKLGLQLLEPVGSLLRQPGSGISSQEVDSVLLSFAKLLPGSIVTYTTVGVIICLLVARSWQARIFNPGGLQQEFRALRMGKKAGLFAMLVIVGLMFSHNLGESWVLMLMNISMVLGLVFVIVGLGLAHALIAMRNNSGFWLVGLYVSLIVLGQLVAPLLMMLSLTDIWFDYRTRFAKKMH